MAQQNGMGRAKMKNLSESYLCVYAREFPAQALLRLRPMLQGKPVAVLDGEAPFQQVCSVNKYAKQMGIEHGTSRAELDSFPSAILLRRSLAEEAATKTALLECSGAFSPRIEVLAGPPQDDREFSCVLDIAGTEKLFGEPHQVAVALRRQLGTVSVTCSLAASGNFHTALCIAKGAWPQITIVPAGKERQVLAKLSLSVLDISEEHIQTFAQWGIASLGELALLPERDLISRLGQEGKRLRELARGEHPHLFTPVEPAFALGEYLELDAPLEILDSLLFGISAMLDQLIARASARILALASVTLELALDGGGSHVRSVRPALPSSDKHLWLKLLHLDLIAHPPQAAVVSMTIHAEPGKSGKLQLGLFSPQLPEPARLDVTLARIQAIVGEERVGSPELNDTHPPDSFRIKWFSTSTARHQVGHDQQAHTAIRRIRPPEAVAISLRNGKPFLFYFRGIQYETVRAYGPWQMAGGWWNHGRWSLEQWDIIASSNSQRLYCCLAHDLIGEQWQMEALYD